MTHAIRFHKTGGPEVLVWEEVALGKPGPGEARIRHTAVGLNFVDIYNRSGLYPAQLPSGLGGEAAGVVEEVGSGVTDLKPGDRVAYGNAPIGAYAEARLIPADRLLKLEQNGLITKAADPGDKRKFIYALTGPGADLAPILVELALYGLKYEPMANMAKEVVLDMQKNKQVFALRLTRNFTPKIKTKPTAKKVEEPVEETLSLF